MAAASRTATKRKSEPDLIGQTINRVSDGARKCGAKNRLGGTCGHVAGFGTDHLGSGRCKHHTGSTKAGKQAAFKERLRLVEPHATTGIDAISRSLASVNGLVDAIELELDEIENSELIQAEALHFKVRIWRSALRELATIGKIAADANSEERRLAIEESIAKAVLDAMYGTLSDLGVKATPEVRAVVKRHFTVLVGGKAQAA